MELTRVQPDFVTQKPVDVKQVDIKNERSFFSRHKVSILTTVITGVAILAFASYCSYDGNPFNTGFFENLKSYLKDVRSRHTYIGGFTPYPWPKKREYCQADLRKFDSDRMAPGAIPFGCPPLCEKSFCDKNPLYWPPDHLVVRLFSPHCSCPTKAVREICDRLSNPNPQG